MGMDQFEASIASYRNGWLVGTAVACALIIGFLVYFRDVSTPLDELLLIGVPIGVTMGALIGVGIDPRSLPRRRRIAMSLSIIVGFVSYWVGLTLYLMSRA